MKHSSILSALVLLTVNVLAQSHPKVDQTVDYSTSQRYYETQVAIDQDFEITEKNLPGDLNYFIVISKAYEQSISQAEFTKIRRFTDNGSIHLRAKTDTTIWNLIFTTETKIRPNTNFAFVSLIKSLNGEKAENELFDAFLKLNLGKKSLGFALAGFEFNFSDSTEQSTTDVLTEAMFSVNHFLGVRSDRIASYKRGAFLGGGAKIFVQRIYVGAHVGIMEISGPFITTYFFAGYYHDPYASGVEDNDENSSGPRHFRNNFYTEFAISASDSKVPVLSDIRLKVGILFPFKGRKDKDNIGPLTEDIKHRIALEVPIDKIFTF